VHVLRTGKQDDRCVLWTNRAVFMGGETSYGQAKRLGLLLRQVARDCGSELEVAIDSLSPNENVTLATMTLNSDDTWRSWSSDERIQIADERVLPRGDTQDMSDLPL
jgi:hypothetical protein